VFEGLLQPTHLILILAITLLVFGPKRLGEVGSGLGKGIREFKRNLADDAAPHPEAADRPRPAGVASDDGPTGRAGTGGAGGM
jgi:sec-independent protein translocase protein TatA